MNAKEKTKQRLIKKYPNISKSFRDLEIHHLAEHNHFISERLKNELWTLTNEINLLQNKQEMKELKCIYNELMNYYEKIESEEAATMLEGELSTFRMQSRFQNKPNIRS